jgi:molybdate transport system substrate-binding protein
MFARFHHLIAACLLTLAPIPAACAQETLTVFAAASLKNALEDAAKAFAAESRPTSSPSIRFSFAASSALAKQIEQGAPADLFASADLEWMDYLQGRNQIRPGTRVDLLNNRLVVVAPADSPLREVAFTRDSLLKALGPDGRLATGEVTSVPIGKYAKAAFEKFGIWADIRPRLAPTENVRAALVLVSRGEAPLGVVYETDARADPRVRVVATFPADSHPPVIYPFAVTAAAKDPAAAARFLDYLKGPAARRFFEAQGFTVIGPGRSGS